MAEPNLTSGGRLAVYQTMFLINRSFHNILKRLEELGSDSLFDSEEVAEYQGIAQELQADINTHLMAKFSAVEEKDWAFFDKIKEKREKHLRGEDQLRCISCPAHLPHGWAVLLDATNSQSPTNICILKLYFCTNDLRAID